MNQIGKFTKYIAIFFYEIVKFLCWFLPILFFSYLALSFFLYYLFPDFPVEFSEKTILSLDNFDLGLILLMMFILTIVGIYFRYREKKIEVKFLRFKSRDELIVALITSFFFSTFFIKNFLELENFENILILFFTLLFLVLLPNFVSFFSFLDLSFFKKIITAPAEIRLSLSEFRTLSNLIKPNMKKVVLAIMGISFFLFIILYLVLIFKILSNFSKFDFIEIILLTVITCLLVYLISVFGLTYLSNIRKLITYFSEKKEYLIRALELLWKLIKMSLVGVTIVSLFIIVVLSIVAFLTWQLNRYADYQRKLRENLTIMFVDQETTTLAQKVRLKGYNFGWRVNKKDRLMSSYGPVFVDEWQEEELIFTIPLHWKEGTLYLWIERIKDDVPEKKLIKSNTVTLKILPRWDFFPTEEELRNKDLLSSLNRAIKKIRRTLFLQKPYFP